MNLKNTNNLSNKILPIFPIDTNFKDHIKNLLPKDSPEYCPTFFPPTFYLPSEDEENSQDLIEYHYDFAYYQALKQIDWNVFLTLKFKAWKFRSLSNPAFKRRKEFLKDLVADVISELDLSLNDLQYFWSEEVNSEDEAHFHVLFYRVYSDKCSIEDLRRSIERNLNPEIVQIPKAFIGNEPPHLQTVKSSEKCARYLLKTSKFQSEPKVLGHSLQFVRFWNRHRNWKSKQAA